MTTPPLTPRDKHLRLLQRNTVYRAYAAAHHRSVEQQYDHDGAWLNAPAYITWVQHIKTEFLAAHPDQRTFSGGIRDHDLWFAWLDARRMQGFV